MKYPPQEPLEKQMVTQGDQPGEISSTLSAGDACPLSLSARDKALGLATNNATSLWSVRIVQLWVLVIPHWSMQCNEDLSQLFWLILQHLIFATKVLIKGNIRVCIGRVSKC